VPQNTQASLDFDLACAMRLTRFENERDHERFKTLIKSLGMLVTAALGGDPGEYADSGGADDDNPEASIVANPDGAEVW